MSRAWNKKTLSRSLQLVGLFLAALSLAACGASNSSNYGGAPGNYYPGPSSSNNNSNSKTSSQQGPTSQGAAQDAGTTSPQPQPDPSTDPSNPTEPPKDEEPKVEVNPWVDPATDNLSTFAIDVDSASYTYSRRLLKMQQRPPASAVRVEEFINFFDYNYADPKDSKPFAIHVDGAISPYATKNYILRVGIQGRRMKPEERPSMHLTFLLDVSCSMRGVDRITLVKKSLNILVDQLREGDTVAIATYAGATRKILEPTDASRKSTILNAINGLGTGGGTSMGSGMVLAYEMASKSFVKGHENRVIVLSDGDANIGRTSHEEILKTIEKYVDQGITMTTVGYGIGNYRDGRMEQLANKGNGNNYYIDNEEQAYRVFRDKFISNMLTIAKDVKIQVEFNKDYVAEYRLIGYENRDIADKDFRNDKVDAGELGAGHNVTALYEIKLKKAESEPLIQNGGSTPLISVRLRYKAPTATKEDPATEVANFVPISLLHRNFESTPWSLRWSTAVMGLAEILRQSPHAATWSLDTVKQIAQKAAQSSDSTHAEFIQLVDLAKQLP